LLGFRKIPFTCCAPRFKDTSMVRFIVCVLGFYGFSAVVPALEREAFDSPFPYRELIVILFFLWGISLYLARKNQTEHERRVIFDDVLPPPSKHSISPSVGRILPAAGTVDARTAFMSRKSETSYPDQKDERCRLGDSAWRALGP